MNILPIRNVDIGKFVDLDSPQKIKREFDGYIGLTVKLVLQFISATFFILLDALLYELLDLIARRSQINYLQEGVNNLNITVQGTGFFANFIRESIDGFNIDEHIEGNFTASQSKESN